MIGEKSSGLELSLEQRAQFMARGVLGPFSAYAPGEWEELWAKIRFGLLKKERAAFPSSKLNYDRHLDVALLRAHVCREQIVAKVCSILGEDVLCWRSEMFSKTPGQAGTGWHQVETFVVGGAEAGRQQRQLVPTVRLGSAPIELTVWTAVTDATVENGCLKFMPGSNHQWFFNENGTMKYRPEEGGNGSFFGYDYDDLKIDPNWTPDETKAETIECKAGEFLIFTAKCMHGSHPNRTNETRLAYVSRYVPTSVKVYDGMSEFTEFGETFRLDRHRSVLVSGKDTYGHNRIIPASSQQFLGATRSTDSTTLSPD
jgi:non-haem Fe2+, alpha-ketoglutarate-dependent halogenase